MASWLKSTSKRRNSSSEPSNIGKRGRKQSPSRHELCKCEECQQDPSPHPETGGPSGGRFFTPDELREHRKLIRNRQSVQRLLPSPGLAGPSNLSAPERHGESDWAAAEAATIIQSLNDLSASIDRAQDIVHNHCAFFETTPREENIPEVLTESARTQLCKLDASHPGNRVILGYQTKLNAARTAANLHAGSANRKVTRACEGVITKVDQEHIRFNEELYNIWLKQSHCRKHEDLHDSSHEYLYSLQGFSPVVLACLLLALIFHLLAGVSMQQCSFLLQSLRFILELALGMSGSIEVPFILRSIPLEIRSVIKKIELEPQKTIYVCCPKCYCLYWMDPKNRDNYPERCTHRDLGTTCGAKLRKSKKSITGHTPGGPAREYHTQRMADYLSRIYNRPDLQPYLQSRSHEPSSGDKLWWDIWDAPALRDILGHDGRPFLQPSDPEEGRLVFSLNMDGFNPYGNKEAGKKASVGGIYMVCLNLPMSIRYDLENMYLVGVIPGPQEPSLHQINHLLRPLVDELLQLWKRGIYLTHTCKYPHGQRIRCALGPLVCDLPAARQMSGISSFSLHNFCSQCTQTRDDLNSIKHRDWTPRNLKDHRKHAEEWKQATTEKEREFLVKSHGVRWSELLRLPYWDPIKFTVIDSMHAFFLRILPHLCREVWGMDVDFDDGDGITFDPVPNQPSEAEMYAAHRTLECDSISALGKLRVAVLRQLCKDTTTVDFRGRKKKLLQRLKDYRIRQGWFTSDGQRIMTNETRHAKPLSPPLVLDFTGYPENEVLQINFDQDVEDVFGTRSQSFIKNLRKSDLITLVRYKVDTSKRPYSYWSTSTVPVLRKMISDKRQELGITDGAGHFLNPLTIKRTRVLGRNVLKEIRNDMAYTMRPSWLSPPPLHPGEKKWGKLTADQWRTFCMQVLPITLTRLWGSHPPESTERKRLDNFMELISAIKLATSRQMTPDRIKKYEAHLEQYLRSLLELYDVDLTPYQHLALHFGPMLERFGPTHSWRCNVFERYNYVMRQIPTNQKFGDLEKTLFTKFLEGQKLRSLLKPGSVIKALRPFLTIFERFFKTPMTGTGLNNNLPYNDAFKLVEEEANWEPDMVTAIPLSQRTLLEAWIKKHDREVNAYAPIATHAYYRDSIHRLGQTFTTRQESLRNSHVAYSFGSSDWFAASITSIFSHTRARSDGSRKTQTFVIVKNYEPVDCADDIAFRRYPEVGGRIMSTTLKDSPVLLSMDEVDSHFVTCSFDNSGDDEEPETLMICLPLEKFHISPG